jgi:integrase/recombinase XerC
MYKNVFNGYCARQSLEIPGKGNRIREVPLNKAIRTHIEKYLRKKKFRKEDISPSAPLFMSRNQRRITTRAIQLNFDKWVKASGIDRKYSSHALRDTVGTELMRKANNIRKVHEFLGHRFVSTTQIYTWVTKEDLVECAELLSVHGW